MNPPDHSAGRSKSSGCSDSSVHLLVMAKTPVPGRVKTRLCPPCTPVEAATVARAALLDTLDAVAACGADRKIIALDGAPPQWLPPGFEIIPQCAGAFDRRLAAAWAAAGSRGVQIGMDTPQVTSADLDDLLADVHSGPDRAVLGPATDGGWWAIGLSGADPRRVFEGIPMSTAETGACQRARLESIGQRVRLAAELCDIDTVSDLDIVARQFPDLRTAAVARRIARRTDDAARATA
ncbi:MAG: DUF2064 domain-containing protein [Acidimicrobiales bacterium]